MVSPISTSNAEFFSGRFRSSISLSRVGVIARDRRALTQRSPWVAGVLRQSSLADFSMFSADTSLGTLPRGPTSSKSVGACSVRGRIQW
jgi:hypothetical protein